MHPKKQRASRAVARGYKPVAKVSVTIKIDIAAILLRLAVIIALLMT
jgi:hypothetical protein